MPEDKNTDDQSGEFLKRNKGTVNSYLKYSGLGVQMALVITAFAFAGVYVDEWLGTDPVFTIILALGGVALSLYIFIRQLLAELPSSAVDEDDQ